MNMKEYYERKLIAQVFFFLVVWDNARFSIRSTCLFDNCIIRRTGSEMDIYWVDKLDKHIEEVSMWKKRIKKPGIPK